MRLLVKEAVDTLSGELVIPSSKYHAHRALILASLAAGTSRIDGLSDAGHVRHTISALRRLGTRIDVDGDTFVVEGGQYRPSAPTASPGAAGPASSDAGRTGPAPTESPGAAGRASSEAGRMGSAPEVSVGSSGSTLYFLTGLASLAAEPVTIVGQRYFQRRPIRPLLQALTAMGVELTSADGCPPIVVSPRRPTGGRVEIAGTLSQWISGLLLLAPFASGPTVINIVGEFNERSYIELTIRMMRQFGLDVDVADDGRRFQIEPDQQVKPATVALPPDIGAAAFGLAACALHPCDVLFRGLSARSANETDHPEADLLDIVRDAGVPMELDPGTGAVRVRHDGVALRPVEVDCRRVPDMLPVLSVLATFADGTSVLRNVAHVRLKESDRVSAMLQLNRMGGRLEVSDDRLTCHGVTALTGADLSSFNDHRVLMSLALAGTRAQGETRLTYPNAYRISYPRFLQEMTGVGLTMSVEKTATRTAAQVPSRRRPIAPERLAAIPVADHVRRWARERAAETAVVEAAGDGRGERTWTWAELDAQADAAASLLLELGVQSGEAVACQLPNWGEFVVLSLASLRIGAVCCPLMPIYREREVAFMLRRSRARVVVVPERFRGREHAAEIAELLAVDGGEPLPVEHVLVVGGGDRLPPGWERFDAALDRQRPDRAALAARRPEHNARAQLMFTSGTSGEPKGVLHRMDVLTRAAAMQARHLALTGDDRVYIPSPLAHQTGFLYGMWVAWLLGMPQIVQPVWDGAEALDVLRRWRGTFVQAATPFLADAVQAVERGGPRPDSLRIFVATGAAVPRALAERATRTLGAAVCGAWGSTESCLGSMSAPGDDPAMCWGTDGRALHGVLLRVTDDDGKVLAAGQEGNFEVKSRCLFDGYLDRPDLTAAAMTSDGWYRSGDLAVIDESGYVRISGRVKDVINRGGEKVPVAEIEQLLHTHPAVTDVAIVAMPDARLGERACAFVVGEPDFDFAEMQRFLDGCQVAKHYWPERLERVTSLPHNPTGKVQKFLLRERIRQLIESEA